MDKAAWKKLYGQLRLNLREQLLTIQDKNKAYDQDDERAFNYNQGNDGRALQEAIKHSLDYDTKLDRLKKEEKELRAALGYK